MGTCNHSHQGDGTTGHVQGGGSGCSCCSMSRRCFLTAMTGAAGTAALLPRMASAQAAGPAPAYRDMSLGSPVDIRRLRPAPVVNVFNVTVRMKPPYWLGWPGTSYDLEGHRSEYNRQFGEMAKAMGVNLDSSLAPIEDEESLGVFVKRIKSEKPHAVLVCLQHLNCWDWAGKIAKAGIPTIIFSPIGTSFTQHTLEISRRPGVLVISSLDTSAVGQAFRLVRAKRQFEETRLLVVAGNDRSESVMDRLGAKVRYIPRDTLEKLFLEMPETDEAREVMERCFKSAKKVVEPTEKDGMNAARTFMTAKHLLQLEQANALTTDCLGMVTQKTMPTPPCMAASVFQDHGVTYGCEADVFGAMSLMLSSYLFDRPGFMNDPVAETVKNVLVASHCVSGTKLNGFDQPQEPYILRSHSESALGVSTQVLWKEGQPVTLARFTSPDELILDTGTVVGNVDTPPAGGCRTSVEIAMDQVEDSRDVVGFHQVVFYGNHRRTVKDFCQMYGVKVKHSPRFVEEKA